MAIMKGSEFGASILDLNGEAREKAILQTGLKTENLPSWLRGAWSPVTSGRITYFAAPDYFSIGDNDDFLRVEATPDTFQTLATAYDAILPTRKMVDDIYRAANTKLVAKTYAPGDGKESSTERMIAHNTATGNNHPSVTNLVAGSAKDVVIGPELDGSHVAIYGFQPDPKVFPHQPYSTIHTRDYLDYAHKGRLVSRIMLLDGKTPISAFEVFKNPDLAPFVVDAEQLAKGVFVPVFPNKGLTFAVSASAPGSSSKGGSAGPAVAGAAIGGAIGGPAGILLGGLAGAILGR